MRGLIANPSGNVNQLETRDGTVLTSPFPFEELYRRYADSWRVAPADSLLSPCGGKEIELGIPKRLFYADDLDPKLRERALGVCTAAGVKAGPLLEACTLDVAVIGKDEAARVFVGAITPAAVGTVTPPPGSGLPCNLPWWVLVLLAVILIAWLAFGRKRTP